MKYFVKVGEHERELVLEGGRVRVDGAEATAHLAEIEGSPVRVLTVGDRVHRVVLRRGTEKGQYTLSIDGWRFDVNALDERSHAIRALSAASSGPKGPAPLVAPMPGLIVRVNVEAGDRVQAGQGLVVMEAMKMENELRAAAAGTVKVVHARPATAVEKGTVLVEME